MHLPIKKCPKCGHERLPEETEAPERCPACGVYFEKWANRDKFVPLRQRQPQEQTSDDDEFGWRAELHERLAATPELSTFQLYGYTALLVLFALWGIRLAMLDVRDGEINSSFMHTILLPIHEAGHIFSIPFGEFFTILGGSLFQLLLPLITAGTMLWQNRDPFGAALGIWWCGVSFIDLAPYIYDAKNPQLTLLGGQTGENGPHDWIYLLGSFGKIDQSQSYGLMAHKLGILIMVIALWWAGQVLWRSRKNTKKFDM
ncbi:MAG: hypothetical protein V4525_03785 [Pseudomonadota bacterium]